MTSNIFYNVVISDTLTVGGNPITPSGNSYILSAIITSSTYTISSVTANVNNIYQIDSTNNAITITLPLITATNSTIIIVDVAGKAADNNINIIPNVADTLITQTNGVSIDQNYNSYTIISNNTTSNWIII
jgi:hypothetical protein